MKRRECPRCWVPLVPEKRKVVGPDVTVDVCPKCRGEFLDRHEIRRLTGDRALDRLLTKHLGIDSDSKLLCPACGGLMDGEDLEVARDAKVQVDVCLSCKGIWLDDGELGKIKESDTDFSKLTPEKLAELFDERVVMDRQRRSMGGVLGRLRKR